jgi:hypothetical protein
MAERGLDQWDAAIAHLREVLEIYIGLDDREMIGRSFTDLAAVSIWAGHFREAAETTRRGLTYLQAEFSADRARLFATLAQAQAVPIAPTPIIPIFMVYLILAIFSLTLRFSSSPSTTSLDRFPRAPPETPRSHLQRAISPSSGYDPECV